MKKEPAATIFGWLKSNLGTRCLAPLTGSDAACLKAAVQIAEACCYADTEQMPQLLDAFGAVVRSMQTSTCWLAYHAIAHARDWGDRANMWRSCDLPDSAGCHRTCAFEPGGSHIDQAKL